MHMATRAWIDEVCDWATTSTYYHLRYRLASTLLHMDHDQKLGLFMLKHMQGIRTYIYVYCIQNERRKKHAFPGKVFSFSEQISISCMRVLLGNRLDSRIHKALLLGNGSIRPCKCMHACIYVLEYSTYILQVTHLSTPPGSLCIYIARVYVYRLSLLAGKVTSH